MNPCRPVNAVPLTALLVIALIGWMSSRSVAQEAPPNHPSLTHELRAKLAEAGLDPALEPWQQDFMRSLAEGVHRDDPIVLPGGSSVREMAHSGLAAASASDGAWLQLPPAALAFSSAIYDPVRNRMVIFGGADGSGYRNEVWALTLAGVPAWSQLGTSGTPPPGRDGHTAVYDPVRDRMIVFGGYFSDSTGHYLNDLWALSLAGAPSWTQLAPVGTPPHGRWGVTAIYEPVRDSVIVFGGYYYDGTPHFLSEVWALSLRDSVRWDRVLAGGSAPPGRYGQTAVYVPGRDSMLVFGGFYYDGSPYKPQFLNDVWVLSLRDYPAWSRVTPTGATPSVHYGHAAVFDTVGQRMIVFGGSYYASSPDFPTFLNDAWALSLTDGGAAWSRLAPTGNPPGGRSNHVAVWDPTNSRVIEYGGTTADGGPSILNDAWALALVDGMAWSQLPSPDGPARGREAPTAIYDPVRDRMILFGGHADGSPAYPTDVLALSLGDTATWAKLSTAGTAPSGRRGHSAIYDPVRDRLIVFGGYYFDGDSNFLNDVWALSLGGAPTWVQLAPSGNRPAGRFYHTAVYDPARDRMLVFGGNGGNTYLNDVWSLSLTGSPAWTQLAPVGGAPAGRNGHGAVYDPIGDQLVVFGGYFNDGTLHYLNDVWLLALASSPAWTEVSPQGIPPTGRVAHTAIYDPVRDRVVVFGGYRYDGTGHFLNETWSLSLTGSPTWSQLAPAGNAPSGRVAHAATYDPVRDKMLVFDGYRYDRSPLTMNEVWSLGWGQPLVPTSSCPGDTAWEAGGVSELSYTASNPYSFAQSADYELTSERSWPGLPVSGTVPLGPNSSAAVPLSFPVPDTAAYGLNRISFRLTLRSVSQSVACENHLRDVNPPALLSFVSAETSPDRVLLVWMAVDGQEVSATVYRRTEGSAWRALGRASTDGEGRLAYEDEAVEPGRRYGYRLGVAGQDRERYVGETWVEVPIAPQFALKGLRPNPTAQGLVVEFSLPDASPARLEVLDIAGRRLFGRDVGALGSGSHVLDLAEGRLLSAGVYLLRLTRGPLALTARGIIVR